MEKGVASVCWKPHVPVGSAGTLSLLTSPVLAALGNLALMWWPCTDYCIFLKICFYLGQFFCLAFSSLLSLSDILILISSWCFPRSQSYRVRMISLASNTFLPCLAWGFLLTSYYIDTLFYLLRYKLPEGRTLVQYNYLSSPCRVYQYLEHSS